MGQRSAGEVMAEGQRLTLELIDLKRKDISGTATAEDKARIVQLDSYLLGLVGEAQALGVGTAVGTGYGQAQETEDYDEDEDNGYDEDEDEFGLSEDEDEAPQNYADPNNFKYGGNIY